jgi:cytochrome b561
MQHLRYSATARLLHWIMAVLILSMLPVGFLMVQTGLARAVQDALFIYHKNIGVAVLLLAFARLLWRWRHPGPDLPASLPAWQARVAGFSHGLLYVLMIAMPLMGYIRVRAGGFPIEMLDRMGLPTLVPRSDALAEVAKAAHYYGGIALAILLVLHIGAALHHALILRDGVWERMAPRSRARKT